MSIFVTGGSGFIGSAVIEQLVGAGHDVVALARSEVSAQVLRQAGARVKRGDLEDVAALTAGARDSRAVIHLGFVHDFSRYKENCELDRRVIAALGAGLRGTGKPLVVTSGTLAAPGRISTEGDRYPVGASRVTPRAATEEAVDELVQTGVNAGVVRCPPTVHGSGDHGFVPMLLAIAREKGVAAYVGEGSNRWSAVHRLDAAKVFTRAIEQLSAGERFHAVAESAVPFRAIAETMGRKLSVPVRALDDAESETHFGWLAWAVRRDCPASSETTRSRLGWTPQHPTLLDDLNSAAYGV